MTLFERHLSDLEIGLLHFGLNNINLTEFLDGQNYLDGVRGGVGIRRNALSHRRCIVRVMVKVLRQVSYSPS